MNYLNESNTLIEVVEYLKEPLSSDEIKKLAKKLNLSPDQFIRKKETIYRDLNLSEASEKELLQAMVSHPILIERPILITEETAAIGRPLENIKNLIERG